jgi:hypothetical protein
MKNFKQYIMEIKGRYPGQMYDDLDAAAENDIEDVIHILNDLKSKFKRVGTDHVSLEVYEFFVKANSWKKYYNSIKDIDPGREIETSDGYIWHVSDDGKIFSTYVEYNGDGEI